MPFTVTFAGIILFIMSGNTFHVVMPDEQPSGTVCGRTRDDIGIHDVFIRVLPDDVEDDSGWSGSIDCLNKKKCKLYPLDDAVITIDGIKNTGNPDTSKFDLSHLNKDFFPSGKLKNNTDLVTVTSASIEVTTGSLDSFPFNNGMEGTRWTLEGDGTNVVVKATPRHGGGAPKVLKLKKTCKGMSIVNTTKKLAQQTLGAMGAGRDFHFLLYYRLTEKQPDDCKVPGKKNPLSAFVPLSIDKDTGPRGDHGISASCSNTQWP